MSYNKYKAKKTIVDDIVFDSKLEAEYYVYLKHQRKSGKIKGFERQVKFVLIDKYRRPNTNENVRSCVLKLDFVVYLLNGDKKYVDTKGVETPEFKIKRKLFETQMKTNLILLKRCKRGWIEC